MMKAQNMVRLIKWCVPGLAVALLSMTLITTASAKGVNESKATAEVDTTIAIDDSDNSALNQSDIANYELTSTGAVPDSNSGPDSGAGPNSGPSLGCQKCCECSNKK